MAMFGPTGRLPSDTTKDFSRAPVANIQRSVFDRSFGYKTTIDAGFLYPFLTDQCYPGDTFQFEAHGFGRLNTPIHPIMDNLYLETYYFFVPYRLIWTNWQRFMGERDPDPDSSIDYLCPQITNQIIPSGNLFDYFGLPVGTASGIDFNNFAGRAYNLIWNEWFRAQWIQDSVTVDKGDGPDTFTDYVLLRRNKKFDYFTSSLPNPQAGDSVDLPLGTSAPVTIDNSGSGNYVSITDGGGSQLALTNDGASTYVQTAAAAPTSDNPLYADLSTATSATINQLRESL